MVTKDKRVDEYIAKAKPFAQPVLQHLRGLVFKACPDVVETVKWGMPFYEYKGNLCCMAGFKEHCAFSFWKSSLIDDPKNELKEKSNKGGEAMGNLGKVRGLKDLPKDKILITFIHQAMKLNEEGIKVIKKESAKEVKEMVVPDYFVKALNKNKLAKKTFEGFAPSHRKEYLTWIMEAKTEVTRQKRMELAIEMMAEGKSRNWKYGRGN